MAILKQILAKAAVVAFVAAVALPTGSVSAAANQVDVYPGNEQG